MAFGHCRPGVWSGPKRLDSLGDARVQSLPLLEIVRQRQEKLYPLGVAWLVRRRHVRKGVECLDDNLDAVSRTTVEFSRLSPRSFAGETNDITRFAKMMGL